MTQRGQMSFRIVIPDDQSVKSVQHYVEHAFSQLGIIVEGFGWTDLNDQFDVVGLDKNGDPWEDTVIAASEESAMAQIPEGVTVANIAPVSIFAATPGGN